MAGRDLNSERHQADIRRELKKTRANLDPEYRDAASRIVAEKVIRSNWFYRAEKVACYLSTPVEVDTSLIILRAWQMKKRVFVPVVAQNFSMQFHEMKSDTDLYRNEIGLYEPADGNVIAANELDIVITPLVAFDNRQNRVGMGGGCFDRSFAFLKHRKIFYRPKLVGVAFECQRVEKVNANPWDIRLFQIITDLS
jgi:5-formyltetrahydrofolate cyclo-ligase